MPPKNWMMIAPGAEALAVPTPKKVNASSRPRPGPGLASMRNRIDLPFSTDCSMPSGVNTPWLIALFRNRTFAGSTMIDRSGSRFSETSHPTATPSAVLTPRITGPNTKNPTIASSMPRMPAEKLFTSISKPGRILPSQMRSICFVIHAASGPMIIAPRNIGMSVPTMTPMVAMVATTPPRSP